MSENDNCHYAGTTEVAVKVIGGTREEESLLRPPRKTDTEDADVTCWGRHVGIGRWNALDQHTVDAPCINACL